MSPSFRRAASGPLIVWKILDNNSPTTQDSLDASDLLAGFHGYRETRQQGYVLHLHAVPADLEGVPGCRGKSLTALC